MSGQRPRRVVVTGLGVVSSLGTDLNSFWKALAIDPPAGHRSLDDWDPSPWLSGLQARHADRFAQFAVAAADLAVADASGSAADAGAKELAPNVDRAGIMIATAFGGVGTIETQTVVRHERSERRVSPYLVPMMMPNAGAAAVSMRYGWHGPSEAILTACAAGTHAIGQAARWIAESRCDVVIVGGAEAANTPSVTAGFSNMRALSSAGRTRPFDAQRDGFVMAEGAAALVLEARDSALARGAHTYGEVLGYGSTSDAHDITAPRADGAGAARCVELALADAGIGPADVRHINAHGTATKLNDLAEANAIARVFGAAQAPPVTSIKGATGHAFGASGAFEAVAVLLSMHHRTIPPTCGLESVDVGIPLDVVRQPRPWQPGPVISNSFGFGGHNGCLVLGPT